MTILKPKRLLINHMQDIMVVHISIIMQCAKIVKEVVKQILHILLLNDNCDDMKKKVGQVTFDEKNEIQMLFERRNGLNELAKILTSDNSELYEKLVIDMGQTSAKFQNWWDAMSQKYSWESIEGGNWEIDFETCDIYLIKR